MQKKFERSQQVTGVVNKNNKQLYLKWKLLDLELFDSHDTDICVLEN